jgi:hypothetical protein
MGATRSVLGNNVTEFTARVQETATTLHQPGKSMPEKVREVVLGKAAVRAIAENALSTETCRKIKKSGFRLKYWLGYEELFCRIYAQFVLSKSGDLEALEEMRLRRSDPKSFFWLWTDQEFSRISRELEIQFQEKGWL